MGLKIDQAKCVGCEACVNICPGDLLYLNDQLRCEIRNQSECWDCMACVKSCRVGAIETKLPFSLANYGASLKPELKETSIEWICSYPNGEEERFTIPR
ncbi:MAG TPA: 4Fe-4S binding protein [Bacillota bacterium]|nr:4Fe-4S binding protein [Bacillota bacterium]HOL10768.1 4Fe-4S binding protein [Bacillota bacterium]HPO98479.1 4Fe-4S binding protein [Bacillota bacterium]